MSRLKHRSKPRIPKHITGSNIQKQVYVQDTEGLIRPIPVHMIQEIRKHVITSLKAYKRQTSEIAAKRREERRESLREIWHRQLQAL